MSSTSLLTNAPNITFSGSGVPSQSIAGAAFTDCYLNEDTGEVFTCQTATVGEQQWIGSQGSVVPITEAAILATDHPNLVAMYTMDNISGATLNDESPNGHDMTITGATATTGLIGDCLDFGAGSNYAHEDLGATGGQVGDAISVSFWVNFTTTTATQTCFIIRGESVDSGTARDEDLTVILNRSGTGNISVRTNDGEYIHSGAFNDGGWHLLTMQKELDAYTADLYINAVFAGTSSGAQNSTRASDRHLNIGSNHDTWGGESWSQHADTKMDQFRMFNRTLTTEEITELYNEGTP